MRGFIRGMKADCQFGRNEVGTPVRNSGFTLLEALVMLGVLAIFTVLLAGVLKGTQANERDQATPVVGEGGRESGAVVQ